jgi:hypothetical protein
MRTIAIIWGMVIILVALPTIAIVIEAYRRDK